MLKKFLNIKEVIFNLASVSVSSVAYMHFSTYHCSLLCLNLSSSDLIYEGRTLLRWAGGGRCLSCGPSGLVGSLRGCKILGPGLHQHHAHVWSRRCSLCADLFRSIIIIHTTHCSFHTLCPVIILAGGMASVLRERVEQHYRELSWYIHDDLGESLTGQMRLELARCEAPGCVGAGIAAINRWRYKVWWIR